MDVFVFRHINRLRSLLPKVKNELFFISQPPRLAQAVTFLAYDLGGTRFECRPQQRLAWLNIFVLFFSFSR
jgi:hypothetical protein